MTYRNRKLLNVAKIAPICFCCERTNDGTVVACHSNQIRDKKGTGHKASDAKIAYCCGRCHHEIDNGKKWSLAQKIDHWELAHRASMAWLFESGIVGVLGGRKGVL